MWNQFFFLTRKKWCLIIILKAETLLLKLIKVYFLKISSLSAEVTARPGDPKGDYRPLDFSVRGLSPWNRQHLHTECLYTTVQDINMNLANLALTLHINNSQELSGSELEG